jgi:hypothetical protein
MTSNEGAPEQRSMSSFVILSDFITFETNCCAVATFESAGECGAAEVLLE